jgi:hypothetical protein
MPVAVAIFMTSIIISGFMAVSWMAAVTVAVSFPLAISVPILVPRIVVSAMTPATLEACRVTVSISITIPISVAVAVTLARLGLNNWNLNFFFVLFPFFDVKAIILDFLIDRSLWIQHEPQGPAALSYGVYWQSSIDLQRCLNELRR